MRVRINFDDRILVAMQGIDPKELTPSLVSLMALFPNVVSDDEVEIVDEESIHFLEETIKDKLPFEEIWQKNFKMNNALHWDMNSIAS